jgi:uncharacterized coiled-coil DUF342 family protein
MQDDTETVYEGALKVLKLLLLGVTEALPPQQGISRLSKHVQPILKTLEKVVKQLGPSQAFLVAEVLQFVVELEKRHEELEDLSEISRFDVEIVELCLQSEGFSQEKKEIHDRVVEAVFKISNRGEKIFIELFDEFFEERVEKWHSFDESVRKI